MSRAEEYRLLYRACRSLGLCVRCRKVRGNPQCDECRESNRRRMAERRRKEKPKKGDAK